MSTEVKAPARPAIKKAAKQVKTTEALVASEPVVLTAPKSPEPESKPEPQPSNALFSISAARVRRHLDAMNLNKKIEEESAKLKKLINEYKSAKHQLESGVKSVKEKYTEEETTEKNGELRTMKVEKTREILVALTMSEKASLTETVKELESQMSELLDKDKALTRERVRFSSNSGACLAIICDKMLQQFVTHAINNALVSKKKIVKVHHMHEGDVDKLSLYPLIKSLPSFVKQAAQLKAASDAEALEKLLAKAKEAAWKEFKAQYGIKKKATKEAAEQQPKAAKQADDEDEPDVPDNEEAGFKFYVVGLCKKLINDNPAYNGLRISSKFRVYLSNLLIEFIHRLSGLIHVTMEDMKVKTVNDETIFQTIKRLLIDGHDAEETITLQQEEVPDPEVVKAELKKKEEAKSNGTEYKVNIKALPKVKGYVAVRTIKYADTGFEELHEYVTATLKQWQEQNKNETEQ